MIALPSMLLLFSGFTALSLSMQRHARQVFAQGRMPISSHRLRFIGWVLIGVSLALRLGQPGWRIGLVEWVGLCGAAAALVVVTLLKRPQWLPGLAIASLPPALLLAALA